MLIVWGIITLLFTALIFSPMTSTEYAGEHFFLQILLGIMYFVISLICLIVYAVFK